MIYIVDLDYDIAYQEMNNFTSLHGLLHYVLLQLYAKILLWTINFIVKIYDMVFKILNVFHIKIFDKLIYIIYTLRFAMPCDATAMLRLWFPIFQSQPVI